MLDDQLIFDLESTEYLKRLTCIMRFLNTSLIGSKFDDIYVYFQPEIKHIREEMQSCIRNKKGSEQKE